MLILAITALQCKHNAGPSADEQLTIHLAEGAPFHQQLAAKELKRYLYLVTGKLPEIAPLSGKDKPQKNSIVLANNDELSKLGFQTDEMPKIAFKGDGFLIIQQDIGGKPALAIIGGTDLGVLYGAYRYIEELGVRFYPHGDVLPAEKPETIPFAELEISGQPIFELRGLLPYHDFPEGPDLWAVDNYKQYLEQMAKMRMNFIGLHNYDQRYNGRIHSEPGIWKGLKEEVNPDGTVRSAFGTSYYTTGQSSWGYEAMNTSGYSWGAAGIFEADTFCAPPMRGLQHNQGVEADDIELFNRYGKFYNEVFGYAHMLGIQTCIGSEMPNALHPELAKQLKAKGLDINDKETIKQLYEGIFTRINRAFPLDHFWLWTSENWTWRPVTDEQLEEVLSDLELAIEAHANTGSQFKLATCGWVLGPPTDRTAFDRILPEGAALSCINRLLGMDPVDFNFARFDRAKWAIPWLEDDPSMISPQLWAARMRRDAADARAYGCNGLMGIHWRTEIIGPNISALAKATWQQNWNDTPGADYTDHEMKIPDVDGTDEDSLYGTVAYHPTKYMIPVPEGKQAELTFHFAETEGMKAGERVFHIMVNKDTILKNIDVAKTAGQNTIHSLKSAPLTAGPYGLVVYFIPVKGAPMVSGIELPGAYADKSINCGGYETGKYLTDNTNPYNPRHRYYKSPERGNGEWLCPKSGLYPVDDFYSDWARAQFGPQAGMKAAKLFAKLDCQLPIGSHWEKGPGALWPDPRPWTEVQKDYAFIDDFKALESKIDDPACLERYHYWLHQFEYAREMNQLGCLFALRDSLAADIAREQDPQKRKAMVEEQVLPLYEEMQALWQSMYGHVLGSFNTLGEMAHIINIEQHSLHPASPLNLWHRHDSLFEAAYGAALPLPGPGKSYEGPLRVVVPACRSLRAPDEAISLNVILPGAGDQATAILYWRQMGSTGAWNEQPLQHLSRDVYRVEIPAKELANKDVEYYIEAGSGDKQAQFPAGAPKYFQTVICLDGL